MTRGAMADYGEDGCPKCGSDYIIQVPDLLPPQVDHNRECGDCAYEWTVPLD